MTIFRVRTSIMKITGKHLLITTTGILILAGCDGRRYDRQREENRVLQGESGVEPLKKEGKTGKKGYFIYENTPKGRKRFKISIPSDFGSNEWPDGTGVIIGKNELPGLQIGFFGHERKEDSRLREYVETVTRSYARQGIFPHSKKKTELAGYPAFRLVWTYEFREEDGTDQYVYEDALYAMIPDFVIASNILTKGETPEKAEEIYLDNKDVFEEILSSVEFP